jgi:hypothetical protein
MLIYWRFLLKSNFAHKNAILKGVGHKISRVFFWHVWIDLGLYKNLRLFLFFSVEPLILYLRLSLDVVNAKS